MRSAILVILLIICSSTADYGKNTSMIIPEGFTAASAGMSGACSAKRGDINALFFNPAGIYGINNFQAMFTYDNNILTNSSSTLSTVIIPAEEDGNFAISYGFDRQAKVIDAAYGVSDLSRFNYITSLSYAFSVFENIRMGITAKYISSEIAKNSASYTAFDAGAVFVGDDGMSWSIAVLNAGAGFNYSDAESLLDREALPLKFGAGFNFDALKDNVNALSFSADSFFHVNESRFDISLGLEYIYKGIIIIRAGNKVDAYGSDLISLGAGFNYDFNGINTRFDYAVLSKQSGTGENGASHLLSISIFF